MASSFRQRVGQLGVPGDQQQHRHNVVVPLVVVEHPIVLLSGRPKLAREI